MKKLFLLAAVAAGVRYAMKARSSRANDGFAGGGRDPLERMETEAADAPDLTPESTETTSVVEPDRPDDPPLS